MLSDVAASVCLESLSTQEATDQPSSSSYLSDLSPNDKPWDIHKAQAVQVAHILDQGHAPHQRQAARMRDCANRLEFGWVFESAETGEVRLKLKEARFCRVRHCPICQWRRSLMWVSRFYHAFPQIYRDHPEWRYVMLTLTVRNCSVLELRRTITDMNRAWDRLVKRKAWPAVGYVRSLEITRGKDGSAHPHFHCLLAVPPSYFTGRKYLSTPKWAALWQEALRVDYTPICEVHAVKPRPWSKLRKESPLGLHEVKMDEIRTAIISPDHNDMNGAPRLGGVNVYDPEQDALQPSPWEMVAGAVVECIKYAVKPDDMLADPLWLIELSSQLKNSRSVALGGELRRYLSDDEPDNLVNDQAESDTLNPGGVRFGWREQAQRYRKLG